LSNTCYGCPNHAAPGRTRCITCLALAALHVRAQPSVSNAWRQSHPGNLRAIRARRRANKTAALLNDLTHAQWLEIQSAQGHRCYYCNKRCKGKLSQDHITPLSKHGSHTLHNVIGACGSCNSKKGTRPPPIPVQPLLLTIAPSKPRRPRFSH
jgi:5-methylcytosine-specific restriction endonuclease McrA